MTSILEAALGYAARGWRVLPVHGIADDGGCTCPKRGHCAQPGKHPAISNWVENATTEAERIRRGWAANPLLNVGLATGERSGFFVLDVDPKHGGDRSLAQLEREHGPLPETLSAITGSGGAHLLFQHVAGMGNRGGFAPGLDIRGDGGQIVAAPSRHMSGGTYRWKDEAAAIVAAPAWLLDIIKPATTATATARATTYYRELFVNGVSEGGRNDAVARMAGHLLRKGVDAVIVLEIMKMWNDARMRPPLPDIEIGITVGSVCSKEEERIEPKKRRRKDDDD